MNGLDLSVFLSALAVSARERHRAADISKAATAQSKLTPTPGDGAPPPLVKVIPGDLGCDLEGGNRARDLDPPREKPADRKRVERPQGPPTDGFKDRPGVCLCSAKRYHPVRLPA